ncbi:histidine kinase [Flavobacterium sp.]|uniref:sensor histidine kinase n=1 Tax=Flavobacterium sp. TaxID=239 RepID=UPI00262FA429|nr:histidine kinase [Flavobacterium sp.]
MRYGISYIITIIIHLTTVTIGRIAGAENPPVTGISSVYPVLSLIFINTFILIIIDVVRLQEAKAAARIEINNLKIANLEAQKQLLVQQLQPHFLFNTLATLKSLIHEDPVNAEKYTLKLSDFMRYSTHGNHVNMVQLSDEISFTKSYIELQEYRFGEALQCSENIALELHSNKIPVFALQLLVENAIKHNYFTPGNPLLIKLYNEGSKICVSNNKTGVRLTERSGLGLKNLNERLLLLTGLPLEKEEDEHFFTVKITIG